MMAQKARTVRDGEPVAPAGRTVRWQTIVYSALSFVPILPVLWLPAFTLQDGGLHLASAVAVDGLLEGRWTDLLEWKATVSPNVGIEFVLVALLKLFSPDVALRIMIIAAMIFFAVAVAALTRSVGGNMLLAVLFLPFQANYLLNVGLLGFIFSVPLAIYAVALVARQPNRPPRMALCILLTVGWFTHFVPAIMATITVFFVVLTAELVALGGSLTRRLLMAVSATVRALLLPALPIFLLSLAWLLTSGVLEVGLGSTPHSLAAAFRRIVAMTFSTVSYVDAESWIYQYYALVMYVLVLAILVARWKLFRSSSYRLHALDGLLLAAIIFAISAIVIPDASSTGAVYIASRISLFSSLMLVAWVVSQLADLRPRVEGRISTSVNWASVLAVVSAACVVVVIAAIRLPAQAAAAQDAIAIRAVGNCIPEGATITQLRLADESRYSLRVESVVHEDGFLAATRSLLALDNESGFYPFYQWKFTDRARADSHLLTQRSGAVHVPPDVDLGRAMRRGFPLDAVLLYGRSEAAPAVKSDPRAVALQHALEAHFRLVEQAEDGLVELWLRKGLHSQCSATGD
jgi:hypothetical protein